MTLLNSVSRFSIGLILLYFVASPGYAAMYKWVDEEGNVQYSEKPPTTDVEVETIKPPPKVNTDSAVKKLEEEKEKAFGDPEAKKEEDMTVDEKNAEINRKNEEIKKENEKIKQSNCELGKKKLAQVEDKPRIYTGEGEDRRRIGEDERQAKIAEAKKLISDNCN